MASSTIRGRVLDGGEWPIADVPVTVSALSPGCSVPDIIQLSDRDGRYVWLGLSEGYYEVGARADGYHLASARTYVPAGAMVRVDFHLTQAPHQDECTPAAGANPVESVGAELTDGDVVDEVN